MHKGETRNCYLAIQFAFKTCILVIRKLTKEINLIK